MRYSKQGCEHVLKAIKTCMDEDVDPDIKLRKIWLTLLITRGRSLAHELQSLAQNKVLDGPFKDMILTESAIAAYMGSVLLGHYEHELHPTIEKLIQQNYTHILNIGCSVGYYAVGLAQRMRSVSVEAFDIDPRARESCSELAKINDVQDRVHIHGAFAGKDFAAYQDKKTLILMDIEGAEADLLRPDLYPALLHMDILVELHEILDATILTNAVAHFRSTHDIQIIANKNALPDIAKILPQIPFLDPFDHLLLGWEKRDGATPWGLFTQKVSK